MSGYESRNPQIDWCYQSQSWILRMDRIIEKKIDLMIIDNPRDKGRPKEGRDYRLIYAN